MTNQHPPHVSGTIKALADVLEWYGEQARLARLIHKEGDAGRHALAKDGGRKAREVLAAIQPEQYPQQVIGEWVDDKTYHEYQSSAGMVSVEAAEALKPFFGDPVMEGLLWPDATPESLVTIRVQKRVYDRARAALRALAGERG